MKKTQFPAPVYSVAMSTETGCIVMIRVNDRKTSVMGSLTREDSIKFAQGIIDWGRSLDDFQEQPAPQVVN